MSDILTLHDRFGDEVQMGQWFIQYRNRMLDRVSVDEIRTKGNRLLINHFKNNTHSPTLCIHFESKEKAEKVMDYLVTRWFHEEKKAFGFWDWVAFWCCPRRPKQD
jgi:hypothetical protein